ncbi:MAG: prolipoprotein diacylglyceryl transferase [Candidatus Moranbacteria bacterium]|jgi:phosphatidylglycerol:prolipoprotein diacylglycerol transferase|nr:prolipoprotein diacylglyceryl transferase [Candidatus Moranbacteria bacterium]
MSEWWQHIPTSFHPIAFTVGFLSVRWYALCFLVSFFSTFGYFLWRGRGGGLSQPIALWYDLFLWLFLGAIMGGHLGYFLLYQGAIFWQYPGIILPYDQATGVWVGVSGMSFHGGLIGVVIALWWFVKKRKLSLWPIADRIAEAAPLALLFGRAGNFLNQELVGRLTYVPWGMYFTVAPAEMLRHPSALYEAVGEGALLLLLMSVSRRSKRFHGEQSALFIVLYGSVRFILEYFREPDSGAAMLAQLWTPGQVYSGMMVVVGAVLFCWLRKKNHGTLEA